MTKQSNDLVGLIDEARAVTRDLRSATKDALHALKEIVKERKEVELMVTRSVRDEITEETRKAVEDFQLTVTHATQDKLDALMREMKKLETALFKGGRDSNIDLRDMAQPLYDKFGL